MKLLFPILIPVLSGLLLRFVKGLEKEETRRVFVTASLLVTMFANLFALLPPKAELVIPVIGDNLPLLLKSDSLASLFTMTVSLMWLCSGVFAQEYMEHEDNKNRYYSYFLLSEGALMLLGFSGNYLTMYLGFEAMTLLTLPLVLQTGTEEAKAAGLKYLFYSVFGASMGLMGFFFLQHYGTSTTFTEGGVLDPAKTAGAEGVLLLVFFLVILGFGTKAGMFPMHDWLPTAHPVAPAPASAVLSGVITKAGVLALIRVVYYLVGFEFLRGTWVQYGWMSLALFTVLMGSMLAYKEKIFKKRLAYSTVSQVSYVLFGLSLMSKTAMCGALLHFLAHSLIKDVLFLSAGAVIHKTGKTDVRELRGIGKEMPVVMWCFTIASLGLIGIPPLLGFISKWYLAVGALETEVGFFSWLGPVILIVSALLTAGYLFSITINGFFPGADYDYAALENKEPTEWMLIPLLLLTVLIVVLGIWPTPVLNLISKIIDPLFF